MVEGNYMTKIYLAGPEVFLPNALEVLEKKKNICAKYGFDGLSPLDCEASEWNSIAKGNIGLIEQANLCIANLTPFRGPSADAGTLIEVGICFGKNIPVYGFTLANLSYKDKVERDRNIVVSEGKDDQGCFIEDFGLTDNLMLEYCVRHMSVFDKPWKLYESEYFEEVVKKISEVTE